MTSPRLQANTYSSLLHPSATSLGAFGPVPGLPADWAVEHVAVLPVWGWGLGAHAVLDHHRVGPAASHLVKKFEMNRIYGLQTG
jgi:hypothetical protein